MNKIICKADCKIYIFCPSGYASGGPEALHQLGHQLNLQGFKAYMYYFLNPEGTDEVHPNYKKYQVPYTSVLENKPEHLMILPETHLSPIFSKRLGRIRKAIWWLSVTNYQIVLKQLSAVESGKKFYKLKKALGTLRLPELDKLKQKNVMHIGHSHFSMVHLKENGIEPVGQISDYMNSAFFEYAKTEAKKEDVIIYNPTKNDEFLDEIMSQTSELNWKPLHGMTPQEVADWMNRAKIYIDFGYHPGKERMPREACIMRCCMIVGKTGSAAYAEDMPIPDKYRFEKSKVEIPGIIERIKDCLTNYAEAITDFEPYRKALYQEEEKFAEDIKKVFVKK
ncbi:MAG TPA: hypothetical protein VK668_08950 [Mucilaginibacter sp.]|nr:hypothetical protein [Mucilaginibacter sp.]